MAVEDTEGLPENLARRQAVLDYVSDIALELAALLEREHEAGLAEDLRQIADKALKTKYDGPAI